MSQIKVCRSFKLFKSGGIEEGDDLGIGNPQVNLSKHRAKQWAIATAQESHEHHSEAHTLVNRRHRRLPTLQQPVLPTEMRWHLLHVSDPRSQTGKTIFNA